MVATLLPFWLQHPSRTMSSFSAEPAWSAGPSGTARARSPELGAAGAPGNRLLVEVLDLDCVAAHEAAWADLVGRALEPNVFLEPNFALPAARHFPLARRPSFLAVWAPGRAGTARLIGLCPVQPVQRGLGVALAKVWTHEQATVSAPLLDRDQAADALEAILAWSARVPGCAGLLCLGVNLDGALGRLLAGQGGDRFAVIERRTRAILTHADPQQEPAVAALTSRRAKELRRQRRRLSEEGRLAFHSARSPDDVRVATERFLELEARGWKGDRRTALLHDPALATFTRTMTRLLAREGKCRIDSLDLDDKPVAMGIVLQSGDRAFFWKTAYDETQGNRSPGKQFAVMLTAGQLGDESVALTDSCASPDHPMIDRIWTERMMVADILVAPPSVTPRLFGQAVRQLETRRRCRRAVKAVLVAARRHVARLRVRPAQDV